MQLFLCAACNRHIKDSAPACPFCGGRRGALVGDSAVNAPRMSRGALVLAASAGTAVALMMTNCSSASLYGMDGGYPVADAAHEASADASDDATEALDGMSDAGASDGADSGD